MKTKLSSEPMIIRNTKMTRAVRAEGVRAANNCGFLPSLVYTPHLTHGGAMSSFVFN